MMEAVEFVHAEGWDAPPTLFGLVPTQLLVDELVDLDDSSPLTLVVQDLPEHILPGSEELGEYVSRIAWPAEVEGVILAQEIVFKDASAGDGAQPRPARLFSGVLRGEDLDQTLLQLRLTDEELEERGAFAQDDIELRGGPGIAPGVLAALRYGLEQDPDELV
ncbi:PPA1309 family protein [Corynebacterium mucifaciens]|uniref:PPA1309 family protein n=1 Tax=Corynebacterium ureicelerivorans TaxID=401472 RepID=UPI0023535B9E|nr:PPA1309 family protein [Corynebacterium ureicelerivorans]MCT1369863.1 PPA1309 family protein [Corynebacterium mucifaciens]